MAVYCFSKATDFHEDVVQVRRRDAWPDMSHMTHCIDETLEHPFFTASGESSRMFARLSGE